METPTKKCGSCDKYKADSHNYCRMCGFHLRKGFTRNSPRGITYRGNEGFCGYCGGIRDQCPCKDV